MQAHTQYEMPICSKCFLVKPIEPLVWRGLALMPVCAACRRELSVTLNFLEASGLRIHVVNVRTGEMHTPPVPSEAPPVGGTAEQQTPPNPPKARRGRSEHST